MAFLDIVIYRLSQKLQAVKTVTFSQSQSWKKMVLWVLQNPTFFRFSAKSVRFFGKLLQNLQNFTKYYIMLPNLPNFTKFHKILPNITKFIPNL